MEILIVSDIGGTQIRVAAFDAETLAMVSQNKISTQGKGQPATERLMASISAIAAGHTIRAIAVAAPGFLDPDQGLIIEAPNIPGWINLPLRGLLMDRFHVPVYIGNDANLAALGEWKFGAGIGHQNLLYLTISTGIGSGVIINGEVLQGAHGMAAEFGHVILDPNGPLCGCGGHGHVEAYSSGTGISNYVSQQLAAGRESVLQGNPKPNAREIFSASKQGDALAIEAFERAGHYLGFALANFLHILNPSIVIFGGGVSRAGDLLFNPMWASLKSSILSERYTDELVIAMTQLGDDVGLKGALALLLSKYRSPEIMAPEIKVVD